MPKRISVKSRALTKANYSRENVGFLIQVPNTQTNGLYQNGVVIVPPTTTQGTRTISKLTIDLDNGGNTGLYWAVVYVPHGTTANSLFSTTGSFQTGGSIMEPNQHVMACGLMDNDAGPHRIKSYVSRKLHSGDFISLIIGSGVSSGSYYGLISYSVKYN